MDKLAHRTRPVRHPENAGAVAGGVPALTEDRVLALQLGKLRYQFPRPTLVMGILNVTPDSFSDGGQFLEPAQATAHAEEMVAEGADLIDVGGESSRPGALPVSEREELRRVMPVLEALAGRVAVPISIDTRKPGVARQALRAGASLVNDIGAGRPAARMWELVAESGAGYVVMHCQGSPRTMQRHPTYHRLIPEIRAFFAERLEKLRTSGVRREQIILDVGIGFGKTVEHNLALLGGLKEFRRFRRPLLLGVSRKSFIGKLLGVGLAARLPAGLACACWAIQMGAGIIRTHDVGATVQALRMTEAILAPQ